MRPIQFES